MAQKIIYIAGRVKGLDLTQATKIFKTRQHQLERQGYTVVNPVERMQSFNGVRKEFGLQPLCDDNPADRKEILRLCLEWMIKSDEIDLLFNWQESEFATKERNIAKEIGMPIRYPE